MTDTEIDVATATPTAENDMLLLQRVSEGDKTAFEELYGRLAPRVFGLVLRLLKDRAQAEEVTQEIFLEVWEQAALYDPHRGLLASWVLTISHRRAVDRIRSAEASQKRDLRVGIRDYSESYDTVSDDVENSMANETVRKALTRLTDIQRRALELVYYGGLSQREAANELHIPVSTIKTRVRHGLIHLRDELGVVS